VIVLENSNVAKLVSTQWPWGAGFCSMVLQDYQAIHTKMGLPVVLTHPLWSPQHPLLTRLARVLGNDPNALQRCTVFDALRRPGWYLSQQG